ncbi:MAG: DUF1499 domain-containing protein [Hyphomonadaceae bacterium]|nr:DUF1499 domain-containing protein [Hyphomonadaceae bacterium]
MAKFRGFWVRLALVVSLLAPVWFLAGALGTKFGLLDWRVGFGLMTFQLGPMLLLGAAAIAALGLLLALVVPPRRGRRIALVALLIPALGLGYAAWVRQQASTIPPIHDVSTDLVDPPGFSDAVVAAREGIAGGNALDLTTAKIPDNPRFGAMAGVSVIDAHRAAYGDIRPLVTDTPTFDAFQVALAAAEQQPGWVIGRHDAAQGTIEATATSFWYGFTDDISIRVRALPDGSGTVIDVRSVSRVGLSDLGANAARIRAYLKALNGQLGEAATGG